jgi:NodT family efflux transporter outer membrane factor (OMF) lipoprotein
VHNGFKVGPNFQPPPAPVAADWIDANARLALKPADDGAWWSVFNDATLNSLIETAYRQNLDLKTAATRVLQARAQRNVAAGNLFPQTQNAVGDYAHAQISENLNIFNNSNLPFAPLPHILNVWATGFNASWELDFWGGLRRSVEAANADLDASAERFHDALVLLLADVATNYVQIRTFQQRIAFARRNIAIQKGSLQLAQARLRGGKATDLDVEQARSNLAQTESSLAPLEIGVRQANNRLQVLLGQPPGDLVTSLAEAAIPTAPPELAVGIPADLLRRRPDVRRAVREVAAQSARVGVAEADFYPRFGVTGFLGYTASDIRRLFAESSFTGLILPNFQWQILNYGRVLNNVRNQEARLQERTLQFQQAVLTAGREVEDALVGFVQYQLQARNLEVSVRAAERSVALVVDQYRAGRTDFNRVFTAEAQLVTQQDQLAAARGNIALSLISVYRALGGGWQFFEEGCAPSKLPP